MPASAQTKTPRKSKAAGWPCSKISIDKSVDANAEQLIDKRHAMTLLKCEKTKFWYCFQKTGRLRPIRFGGRVFYRRAEVEEFVHNGY